jgi:dTDP-4-amino-4,6-dideoxygalactose transaminase
VTGARPIYVDIDRSLNIDLIDAQKKLLKDTSDHRTTYARIPVHMDNVLEFAKKNNLIVIEDCAHSLGAHYQAKNWDLSETRHF